MSSGTTSCSVRICVIRVSGMWGQDRKMFEEIMTAHFLNLMKTINA